MHKKKNNKQILNFEQVTSDIKKSVYKSILKSLKQRNRDKTKAIIEDIADPNYKAQVDPDQIPPKKMNVVNKNEKGLYKLKVFLEKRKEKTH